MMTEHPLVLPVLGLVAWSLVVWGWMAVSRVKAMRAARIHPQKAQRTRNFETPGRSIWVADNYNHLMEQPTIFYAVCLSAQIVGADGLLNVILAWIYVALRIVHTGIQTSANRVMPRFYVFIVSTLVLIALTVSTLAGVLTGA